MRNFAVSALTTIGLVLGGCTTPYMKAVAREKAQVEAVETSLEGARYVAIGSSYAAGPFLPPPKPGAPARCGQSLNNYPTLLAERFGMVLVDRSCSGATTDHVLGSWGEVPPQIASVDTATKLVTVTIGGNDLSYVGNLFSASCAFHARAAATAGSKPKPCPALRVPTEADYARVEMQLSEISRRVREAAPQARLVFVQYPNPLPAGALCAVTPLSAADAAVIRKIGVRLEEITDRVALQRGAIVVEMRQASLAHSPCDAEPWVIGAPAGYDKSEGLEWHLNKAGMKATAEAISYWLVKDGVKPVKPTVTVEPSNGMENPPATMPAPGAPQPADKVPAAPPTPAPPADSSKS